LVNKTLETVKKHFKLSNYPLEVNVFYNFLYKILCCSGSID